MVTATAPASSPTTNPYAAVQASTNTATAAKSANEAGSADRFLKLLVTQMQNQDPLSPMDNAQLTSQLAQINTVNGIEKLNTTVEGLNAQFVQMQAVTAAGLVGHNVTLPGSRMAIENGAGSGGFELTGGADNVRIEILNPGGRVVESKDLGPKGSGRHSFEWAAAAKGVPDTGEDGAPYSFRVVASNGTVAVPAQALMQDRVVAVSSKGNSLVIDTQHSGSVAYSDVKAFN
jgi:flagellar basal-body rod modification protein FlgD